MPNYPIVLPDIIAPVELPQFSGTAYTILQIIPNARATRGSNTRVTRAVNNRVTRGYYSYTINSELVVVELPQVVAPVEVK